MASWRSAARAERRAPSLQMGWPEGASAECGRARPSASATICAVAAVPRNWQPPPGEAQARQPSSAASCSVMRPCAKRAPSDCDFPASSPSLAGSVTPPGTITAGSVRQAASAIVIAGRPLSQVATPTTARRFGSERMSRPQHDRRVVAVREAVEHPGRALRAAVAGVGAVGGKRDRAAGPQLFGGGLDQQADLPVAGVVAERERRAVRVADAAHRAQQQHLGTAQLRRAPSPCRRRATSRRCRRWDGRSGLRASAAGRRPGPGCDAVTSKSDSSPESRTLLERRTVAAHAFRPARRGCAARRCPGRRSRPRRLPRGRHPSAG